MKGSFLLLAGAIVATTGQKADIRTAYQRMQQKERLDHLGFKNCEALELVEKIQDAVMSDDDWVARHRMEPDRCLAIHAAWEADKTWLVTHDAPRGVRPFDLENDEHPDFNAAEAAKINKMFGLVWPRTPTPALPTPTTTPTDPRDGEITPPRLVRKVEPLYPEAAQKAGKQGAVILQAIIGSDGNVEDLKVSRSLDPLLDVAAMNAVRLWKYVPATKAGQPVRVYLTVTVSFLLRR